MKNRGNRLFPWWAAPIIAIALFFKAVGGNLNDDGWLINWSRRYNPQWWNDHDWLKERNTNATPHSDSDSPMV